MKVCSLYGAGYYYMPGTDICVKLGGYVRYQMTSNPGSSISSGPLFGAGGTNNRTSAYFTAHRTRALITVDTRQQTAYGTLRTYILLGFNQDSTAVEATASHHGRRRDLQQARVGSVELRRPGCSCCWRRYPGDRGHERDLRGWRSVGPRCLATGTSIRMRLPLRSASSATSCPDRVSLWL